MARLHRCAAQRVDRQSQRLVRVLPWCREARENPRFGMSRYIAHTLSIAHKCRERVRRNYFIVSRWGGTAYIGVRQSALRRAR